MKELEFRKCIRLKHICIMTVFGMGAFAIAMLATGCKTTGNHVSGTGALAIATPGSANTACNSEDNDPYHQLWRSWRWRDGLH